MMWADAAFIALPLRRASAALSAKSAEHRLRHAHIKHHCMLSIQNAVQLAVSNLVRIRAMRRCDEGAVNTVLVRMRRPRQHKCDILIGAHTSEAFRMPVLIDAFSLFRHTSESIWKWINTVDIFLVIVRDDLSQYRARKELELSYELKWNWIVIENTGRAWRNAKFRIICFLRIVFIAGSASVRRLLLILWIWMNKIQSEQTDLKYGFCVKI